MLEDRILRRWLGTATKARINGHSQRNARLPPGDSKPSQAWHQHEAAADGIAYMKINSDKEQLDWRNNNSSSSLPVTNQCVPARNECGGGLNVHTTHITLSNNAKRIRDMGNISINNLNKLINS